jgi:hypothetical protein
MVWQRSCNVDDPEEKFVVEQVYIQSRMSVEHGKVSVRPAGAAGCRQLSNRTIDLEPVPN